MTTATISPKFQVVIPREVREKLKIHPGQKVHVIAYNNRIEMIPVRPIEDALGFLEGMDLSFEREPDRL